MSHPSVRINAGTLVISEISTNEVIFDAINIVSPANRSALADAVRQEFHGDYEEISGSSNNHYFAFTRSLNQPLRDPQNFLLATQRKLLKILEELEGRYIEESLMRGE